MLRTLMPSAQGEGPRVVLLAGEAGAGKSRLAREFAAQVEERDTLVLQGSCDSMVRTPYGPFVEALNQLLQSADASELRDALNAGSGELIRLLPDLPSRVGEMPAPVAADPDTERHRLHSAVADLFAALGSRSRILLVLEDLHWADGPTLLLLRHLARSMSGARLLILATFRDSEAELREELSSALADLRRSDDVLRMRLDAFSGGEVADLVRCAAGIDVDTELGDIAATIHDLTGGNAFLVCELWRALIETGTVEINGDRIVVTGALTGLDTPESVREVASQRLARLDPQTINLLELAAVAGPEFELEPLRVAARLAEPELLVALEQAVASGMVEELPSQRLGCRFSHELVRRALYGRLSRVRRAELHLRVGEALESGSAVSDRDLADLAHHFGAAAPLGGAERAIDYNVRAARAAASALAFEDAATRLRTALEIGLDDERARTELLLELGTVSHRAGKSSDALEAFGSAAEIARELGHDELFAQAAIGYEESCWRPAIPSEEAIELLEEALEALDRAEGSARGELRIALLAGLARALGVRGNLERGEIVRENAIGLARRHGDRDGLSKVLVRSYWGRATASVEEVLETITEARDLAAELGDTEVWCEAMAWRVPTFLKLNDLESARAEVESLRAMAEQTAQPFMNHVAAHDGSAIALCDGRLAEAETMAERSHEWAHLLTGREASGVYGIQMFGVRREQGRLAELAPAIRILAGATRQKGPWRPGFAAVLAELGMGDEARRELDAVASRGLDEFRDSLWFATLTYLTDACAALGDEKMAAILYPEFEPLAGSNVVIGHLVAYYGSADRYLGMLATVLGESERAESHFERALERDKSMGASTWVAHTAYEYARMLLACREGERAEALLSEAAGHAERIGMAGLLGRIRSIGVPAPRVGLPDGLSPREAQILELVAKGLSNREIGVELAISEHTAANHVRSILRKTACGNRTEAASYAHRHGLTSA